MSEKKLLIGPKVRRLRLSHHLTQAQMAADLDISPAYLNLIESNQRPLSAQVLVKLAGAYDIDLPAFAHDEGPEIAANLRQVFAVPALRDFGLSRQDFEDMAKLSPEAVEALLHLTAKPQGAPEPLSNTQGEEIVLADQLEPAFARLEALAREIGRALGAVEAAAFDKTLAEACPFSIDILPVAIMGHTLRRYDLHRRRLLLHRALPPASRRFQTLVQLLLQGHREALDAALPTLLRKDEDTLMAARLQAANHVAGAILMPADIFQKPIQEGLDLAALAHVFDVTWAQVAQRIARLRPSVLVSVDGAGRLFSQRGLAAFPEWRGVLACPDWGLYDFSRTGVDRQLVRLPSGAGFECHMFTARLPNVSVKEAFPIRAYALALPMEGVREDAQDLTEAPYHGLNDLYRRDMRAYSA